MVNGGQLGLTTMVIGGLVGETTVTTCIRHWLVGLAVVVGVFIPLCMGRGYEVIHNEIKSLR